jgi:hypothetical protein
VEVSVPIPEGCKVKQLSVNIKRNALTVKNLINGDMLVNIPKLNAAIGVDDSTWTVENNVVCITLQKEKQVVWRLLNADGVNPY